MTKEQILEILQHPEVNRLELTCRSTSPEQEASIEKFRKSLDENDLADGLFLSSGFGIDKRGTFGPAWDENDVMCSPLITNFMPIEYEFPDYFTEYQRSECYPHKYVSIMLRDYSRHYEVPVNNRYDDEPVYAQWCSDPDMGGCYL